MGIEGEEAIVDGLEFIEASKTAPEKLHIGRNVIVIGAGNTAVDCATIAKRLGAERVTMVYRRTDREMSCYEHEYDFARKEGIEFRFLSQPRACCWRTDGRSASSACAWSWARPMHPAVPRRLPVAGSEFVLPADQIVKAVGQEKPALAALLGLETKKGFIAVDASFQDQRCRRLCHRRLHPRIGRGFHRDGRSGRQAGRRGNPSTACAVAASTAPAAEVR